MSETEDDLSSTGARFLVLLGELAAAPDREPPLRPGTRIGGAFVIERPLGRGGMGAVYLARDERLERPVAIKVAHGSSIEETKRLLREARSLARLAHPHVVTVHEVGRLEGERGVYIVMELVEGGTLRQWLEAEERRLQDILRVLAQAGEGLLAAHQVGLLHRDLKPDNVLVGRDGRARVSDFGLASALEVRSDHPAAPGGSVEVSGVGGTPRYMAPEQIRGDRLDARADQYAFGLMIYEVLVGEPAFSALEPSERLAEMRMGPPSLALSEIPARLRPALARALEHDPGARHPSLEPLVRALEPELRGRRAALAGAALTLGLGGAAALVTWASHDPCRAAPDGLHAKWEETLRPVVAGVAGPSTIGILDDYAASWEGARREACEARSELAEPMFHARMLCLHDLERSFLAVARVGKAAPSDPLLGPSRLLPPSQCDDEQLGLTPVPPPPDEVAEAVDAVRVLVAEARALEDAASYEEGYVRARAAIEAADATRFGPARAEARYAAGRLERHLDRLRPAAKTFEQAYLQARGARHDRLSAEIAGELAYLHGFHLSDIEAGKRWADLALADVARFRGAELVEARVLMNTGTAFGWAGAREEGIRQHRRALELVLAHRPADHPEVARARTRLGSSLARTEAKEEGLGELREAVAIVERTLGPEHPALIRPLTKLGLTLSDETEAEAALDQLQRALRISRAAHGEAHSATGLTWLNLGVGLYAAGRVREAIEPYERALAVLEASLGPEHPDVALVSSNLGLILSDLGERERGLEMQERALAVAERAYGDDNPALLSHLINVASALVDLERWTEALAPARRAEALAPGPPYTGFAHALLGESQLGLENARAALSAFERSLESRGPGTPARPRADSLFGAARSLRALEQEPARARGLAAEAAELLEDADDPGSVRLLQRIRRWQRQAPSR